MNDDLFKFQVLDWDFFHSEDDEGKKQFVIQAFGKTRNSDSVYIEILNFKPFFFIEIQDNWSQKVIDALIEEIRNKIRVPQMNEDGETQWVKCPDSLVDTKIVRKHKFWGFTNYKLYSFLQLNFNDYDSFKACERSFKYPYKLPNIKYPIKIEVFESNMLPMLKFIHIRDLDAAGQAFIPKNKLIKETELNSCCKLNYSTDWENISNINKIKEDRTIEKFIVAAIDIEVTSESGNFPQFGNDGDMVIQIGITLSLYGQEECYAKYILCLLETSPIEGADVQWFKTEPELFLAFPKLLKNIEPDVITGFNILGFDFNYLHGRSIYLASKMTEDAGKKFLNNFAKMSRIVTEVSPWKEQKLASSALGENILKYYKMTGRVIIDLMKAIQGNPMYKLSSYKLDSVASHFIRESVTGLTRDQMRTAKDGVDSITQMNNSYRIDTKSTFGLNIGDFITILYSDSSIEEKYNNGEKFKVIYLEKKCIIIEGSVNTSEFMNKGYKVFWSQAKDDIKVSQIFSNFKGTPDDRAIIAKYCLMDCQLCNRLIAKLQILTNNFGMAKVCSVPLSFLSLRGQGIKIFSLIGKKNSEKNHLMRVIKKDPATGKSEASSNHQIQTKKVKNVDDLDDKTLEKFTRELNYKNADIAADDDDEGYEGAIVFEPLPGVYYEPIPVLDFASLYPSAMIFRNLSHETWCNDPTYENITGYRYHLIWYKKNNGEIVTCKFAEKKDGTKGIIPEILMDLLSARKKYKKLMNEEAPDSFAYFILDGLQQAYKVTANSLYGQTGATTSPVCMKEIAASTTATGREMLQFSKYFIENIFSKLINLVLTNKKKYMEEIKEVFLYYPTDFVVKDNENQDINIHVNTDKFDKIPDKKFIRKSIGYEKKIKFPSMNMKTWNKIFEILSDFSPVERTKFKTIFKDHILDVEDCHTTDELYTEYKSIWNKVDVKNEKELETNVVNQIKDPSKFVENLELVINETWDKIFEILLTFSPKERTNFKTIFKDYILDAEDCYTTAELYTEFESIWNKININNKKELRTNIINQIEDVAKFVENLELVIDEMGYNNKEQLFEKFYESMKELLVGHSVDAKIIYGDTDSVFFCAHIKDDETGELLQNNKGLCIGIRLGIWASILITTLLPPPMAQEYEKVLWPFIIQGKKRYVGNLYEKDPNSFKQKSMGIELKRRDNAQIVKIISAGIIHKILNERDSLGAYEFMRDILKKITTAHFSMDKFVITKTLKGNALTKVERIKESKKEKDQRAYVDRTRIVHAVLADRMADRDPGNKPLSNDRVPYVYTVVDGDPQLQGDRVESPEYIIENNLKIDYLFYITNQIMKPALRFLNLITQNAEKLFKDYITREENRRNGILPMAYYAIENENTEIDQYFEENDSDSDKSDFVVVKPKKIAKKKTKVNLNEKDNSKAMKSSADFDF
jgi:DNA polymerase elongation subunit (family B)